MLLVALLFAAAPKLAVLDTRTGAQVDPALGGYLAQVLAGEVQARTGVAPLLSADVTAMLGFERNKRMLGCSEDDSSCLAEITGALGVDQLLVSSVAVSGGRYLLSASLLDSRHARAIKRSAQSAPLDHDALVYAVRRAAWEIFGGPEPQAPAPPQRSPKRTWAAVTTGAAVVLAATGAVVGANALAQAKDGAPTAKPRAHLADMLFATAIVAGGAAAYLWLSPQGAGVGGAW